MIARYFLGKSLFSIDFDTNYLPGVKSEQKSVNHVLSYEKYVPERTETGN